MVQIKVDINAMQAAVTALTGLSNELLTLRNAIVGAEPRGYNGENITTSGGVGSLQIWGQKQAADPLGKVLDVARLLSTTGNGEVTFTVPGTAFDSTALSRVLGDELAKQLSTAEGKELKALLETSGRYNEDPAVQDSLIEKLGQAGIVSLLTRAGRARIPMDQVTKVFSEDSQGKIADWVESDIAKRAIDLETVTLLNGFGRSKPFASKLFEDITPKQISDAMYPFNSWSDPVGGDAAEYRKQQLQIYQRFLSGAGTAFATYTGTLADPSALVATWTEAITGDDPGMSAPLTLFLRKAGENAKFNPDFLFPLTENVFNWEQEQPYGLSGLWNSRASVNFRDPDIVLAGGPYPLDGLRNDGLANLLGAMENSPEAAQKFFALGYKNGEPGGTNSRVEYLMTKRTFSRSKLSDEGYGLGAALTAASAPGHNPTFAAGFATDLFNFSASAVDPGGTFNNGYWGYPGTSVALGNIATAYSEDVFDVINGDHYTPTGSTDLRVDQDILKKVFAMVGAHEEDRGGLEAISAAMLVEGNQRQYDALVGIAPEGERSMDDLSPMPGDLDAASFATGEVLGRTLDWGLSGMESQEKIAAARAELTAKALGISAKFIPGVGKLDTMFPDTVFKRMKDTLWETAYNTGVGEITSAITDSVKNSPDASSNEYAAAAKAGFGRQFRYSTYNQLLRAGYLDENDPNLAALIVQGEYGPMIRPDVHLNGSEGLPSPKEAGITQQEAQRREEERRAVQKALNYLENGPPIKYANAIVDRGLAGYSTEKPR